MKSLITFIFILNITFDLSATEIYRGRATSIITTQITLFDNGLYTITGTIDNNSRFNIIFSIGVYSNMANQMQMTDLAYGYKFTYSKLTDSILSIDAFPILSCKYKLIEKNNTDYSLYENPIFSSYIEKTELKFQNNKRAIASGNYYISSNFSDLLKFKIKLDTLKNKFEYYLNNNIILFGSFKIIGNYIMFQDQKFGGTIFAEIIENDKIEVLSFPLLLGNQKFLLEKW